MGIPTRMPRQSPGLYNQAHDNGHKNTERERGACTDIQYAYIHHALHTQWPQCPNAVSFHRNGQLVRFALFSAFTRFFKILTVVSRTTTTSAGIAVFESAQNNLKDGGNGIPAVIRNRFDIFKQWDQVEL